MNATRRYPVHVVAADGDKETYVENVRAVNGNDLDAVAYEITKAEVVGTAVGANILPRIAQTLAKGLSLRWECGNEAPLNIILCENLVGADKYFRELVAAKLEDVDRAKLSRLVGFVRASVGRMVPVMTDGMREGNILRICVEAYDHLPVDAEGFVGQPPYIYNMECVTPFDLYIQRKLYIHNMGHAAVAYLGALKGYHYIWEAVGDSAISELARAAMKESATAIATEHGVTVAPLFEHIEDLLRRFANLKLGDTIERVGRDLPRKLAPCDRLVGAVALCAKWELPHGNILEAIAAALLFDDSASKIVKEKIRAEGPRSLLDGLCGLSLSNCDKDSILTRYERLKAREGLSGSL